MGADAPTVEEIIEALREHPDLYAAVMIHMLTEAKGLGICLEHMPGLNSGSEWARRNIEVDLEMGSEWPKLGKAERLLQLVQAGVISRDTALGLILDD